MIDVPDAGKLREAFAARPREAEAGDDIDAERIWRAVNGELGARERQAVVEETVGSPAAAEAWRLAEELRRSAGLELAEQSSDRNTARRSRVWLVAAMVLLAAGIVLVSRPWQPEEPVVYRRPSGMAIESVLGAESRCTGQVCALDWTDVAGAEGYRLRITDEGLEPLLEIELSTSDYRLDRSSLGLGSSQTLLWQVEATTESGERVSSPTFVLELD